MRKSIIRTTCSVVAASALVAAMPLSAEAKKPAGGFKQTTFKATLRGSQVTTWEYHNPDDPDNRCDAGSHGYGDQTIKFDSKRTFKITFTRPPKGQPNLLRSNGRPSVLTAPLFLSVDATAERNGDYKVDYDDAAKDCGGGIGGGGGGGYTPAPKDCGVRHGRFQPSIYFHDQSPDADIVVPFGKPLPERNTLKLEGNGYEWLDASGTQSVGFLDSSYLNCPMMLQDTYVEKAGNIFISPARLDEKQLFDKKRRKIVVSGHHIQKRRSGQSSGQTILAWNLRLTRVR